MYRARIHPLKPLKLECGMWSQIGFWYLYKNFSHLESSCYSFYSSQALVKTTVHHLKDLDSFLARLLQIWHSPFGQGWWIPHPWRCSKNVYI